MSDSPLDIPLPSIDKSGENAKYHAFVKHAHFGCRHRY